jgi:hypothetical protein
LKFRKIFSLLADSKSAELKILASYWLAQGFDRFLRRISDAACSAYATNKGQKEIYQIKKNILESVNKPNLRLSEAYIH